MISPQLLSAGSQGGRGSHNRECDPRTNVLLRLAKVLKVPASTFLDVPVEPHTEPLQPSSSNREAILALARGPIQWSDLPFAGDTTLVLVDLNPSSNSRYIQSCHCSLVLQFAHCLNSWSCSNGGFNFLACAQVGGALTLGVFRAPERDAAFESTPYRWGRCGPERDFGTCCNNE